MTLSNSAAVQYQAKPPMSEPRPGSIYSISLDRRIAMVAVAMTVPFWTGILEIYGADISSTLIFGFGSIALMTMAVREEGVFAPNAARDVAGSILGLISLASAWVAPFGLSHCLSMLGAGLLIPVLLRHLPACRRLGYGTILLALGGMVQASASVILGYVLLRIRYWPVSTAIAAPILNLLGLISADHDGTLCVMTSHQLLRIVPNSEKMGLLEVGIFTAGAIPFLWGVGFAKSLMKLLTVNVVFIGVRYIILVCVYAQTAKVDWFWDPYVNGALVACLALAWSAAMAGRRVSLPMVVFVLPHPPAWPGSAAARLAALGIASSLLGFSLFAADPGHPKRGNVLVDESHSDWEWTVKPFDTEWYGDKAGYNYATMYEHLAHFYHMDRHEKGEIDSRALSDVDVLILKTPTRSYSDREVDAIEGFVSRGGGLYLIGDHTNVFGMTTFLNAVAGRFGFLYNYDATYDMATGNLQKYTPGGPAEATTLNVPKDFVFGTSCSLRPSWSSRVTMRGYGIRSLYLDYARRSFFPEGHLDGMMDYGWIAQALTLTHGKGRVAAFTDSTIFSNFWYFVPGKSELFLGTVEWLNRTNSLASPLLLLIACLCLSASIWLFLDLGSAATIYSVIVAAASLSLGVLAADRWTVYSHSSPKQRTPIVNVAFERDHCAFNIPADVLPGGPTSFLTFYTNVQRIGLRPISPRGFSDILARSTILFMVNPVESPSTQEIAEIEGWMNSGGILVVLDGLKNPHPLANDWLDRFGVRFVNSRPIIGDVVDATGRRWWSGVCKPTIGGTPFLEAVRDPDFVQFIAPFLDRMIIGRDWLYGVAEQLNRIEPLRRTLRPFLNSVMPASKEAVATVKKVGSGKIIIMGISDNFDDTSLGSTRSVPSEILLRFFDFEYALLRALVSSRGLDALPIPD